MLTPTDQEAVTRFTGGFNGRLVEVRQDGKRFRGESTPVRFLRKLFHPGDGYINLRAIDQDRDKPVLQRFIPADRPELVHQFINDHPDSNIYFGVASRRSNQNGRLENCNIVRALWVDVDYKITPEVEARAAIAGFSIEPSIIVATGGGLHVYWILDEPYDVQTDAVRLKSVLRRLASALNADMAATDPARVLRMPATLNVKYDPAREVVLERLT